MTTSQVPAVLDALIAYLTANLSIEVKDGQPPTNVEDTSLWIGGDLDENRVEEEQVWAGLGHVTRDEVITIPNLLWYISGDDDLSACRLVAKTYLDVVENYLRTNETLGFTGAKNIRGQIVATSWIADRTDRGLELKVGFTVNVQARI